MEAKTGHTWDPDARETWDPDAFRRAYAEHAGAVHRTAWDVLRDAAHAEEVVQDVFLALWRRPDRFDPARADLGTYLRLLARSRALDALRAAGARRRAQDRLADVAAVGSAAAPDAATAAVAREQRSTLATGIRRLPDGQRRAVALTCIAGLTVADVAGLDGVPLGTAKSRVRLGMSKLRAELITAGAQPA